MLIKLKIRQAGGCPTGDKVSG